MYNENNTPAFYTLVIEFCNQNGRDTSRCIFTTFKEKEGFISLRQLFVQHTTEDPSEASFAEAVFGDVGYWVRVRELQEMKQLLPEWREEADVLRKSKAFQAVVSEVRNEGKNAFAAAKYLIEEPWKGKHLSPADGRKARANSKKTSVAAAESRGLTHDIERLKEDGFLN
jgi:hypothetical protein